MAKMLKGAQVNDTKLEMAIEKLEKEIPFLTVYYDLLGMLNKKPDTKYTTDIYVPDIEYRHKDNCPLPYHDDGKASFTYYPETQTYYCFGCMSGGSVITLWYTFNKQLDKSYRFITALRDLAEKYSIKIDIFDVHDYSKVIARRERIFEGVQIKYSAVKLKSDCISLIKEIPNTSVEKKVSFLNRYMQLNSISNYYERSAKYAHVKTNNTYLVASLSELKKDISVYLEEQYGS